MTIFTPKFYFKLGESGKDSVYVQASDGTWHSFNFFNRFKIIKRSNQISEFELEISDIGTSSKDLIKEFAKIIFLSSSVSILKGRIQKVEYSTAYECKISGYGMEALLLDQEFIKSGDKRVQYTNTSAQTIAKEMLSEGSDGSSPWIMSPNTTGLFSTDYGNISMRIEYGNRLNSLAKLAESLVDPTSQMSYDWWVTQDSLDYDIDYFNIAPLRPNNTRATVSQKTFTITGASANCERTAYEKDITNLANFVGCLGYGDGTNQLETNTYNASPTYTTLNENLTSSDATITLTDASSFASSGEIRIAKERITYTGKSTNDLTGCTRGANSTTAKEHKKGCYVEKYVIYTSPEADSSISDNGLMDYTVTNRNLRDEATAELVASKILLERMAPIKRITVVPYEPDDILENLYVGDLVTITDAESGIDDDYRIIGINYNNEYGYITMEIEASNRSLTFIEQMQKQKEEQENMAKYMQGSTNIYQVQSYENCDSTHYLNVRFYIPTTALAINHVKLSFNLKDYRSYHTVNADESAHTHGVPSLTVSGATSSSNNTAEYFIEGTSIWDVGQTNDTSVSSSWHEANIPSAVSGVFSGVIITGHVDNYSGANDSYDYEFKNITTNTVLSSGTQAINDNSGYTWNLSRGTGTTSAADTIRFTISDGIVGTAAGKSVEATLIITLNSKSTHTHTVSGQTTTANTTGAGSAHTHGITRGITEDTLTSPSVDVYAGADGSESSVDTYNSDQTDIDITSNISTGWNNVQFRPNKNMRIEANVWIQIFVESK